MDKENVTADKPSASVKLMKYSIDSILGKCEPDSPKNDFMKFPEKAQISVPRCKHILFSLL